MITPSTPPQKIPPALVPTNSRSRPTFFDQGVQWPADVHHEDGRGGLRRGGPAAVAAAFNRGRRRLHMRSGPDVFHERHRSRGQRR